MRDSSHTLFVFFLRVCEWDQLRVFSYSLYTNRESLMGRREVLPLSVSLPVHFRVPPWTNTIARAVSLPALMSLSGVVLLWHHMNGLVSTTVLFLLIALFSLLFYYSSPWSRIRPSIYLHFLHCHYFLFHTRQRPLLCPSSIGRRPPACVDTEFISFIGLRADDASTTTHPHGRAGVSPDKSLLSLASWSGEVYLYENTHHEGWCGVKNKI